MTEAAATTTRWKTAITQVEPNHVRLRGYEIGQLMGQVSFGAAVYLALRGELPPPEIARLMDAILVSSIDHGATPPSVMAARTVTSTGGALGPAVAAGLLTINEYHGGAIEGCAEQLATVVLRTQQTGEDLDTAAAAIVAETRRQGLRLAGFGHRIHSHDPRTARLFELAVAAGAEGPHLAAARALERALAASGKALPINVDGAIAAVLADLGFDPASMNGLFMAARVPGLIAHAVEERRRERPMRRIDPVNHEYDGPAPRTL